MKTIHVTASREYDVVIGAGLLDECGQRIAAAVPGAEKAVVYTDTTVFPLYAKRVTDSLKAAGFTVLQDYFLAGEHSKTFRNWERILRFFTENRVSRSDVVVALGGGVVGDMVGFAAACYQRGGTEPTVTDAALTLGFINPDNFNGGKLKLSRELARKAIAKVAEPLGVSIEEAAAMIYTTVNHNMADGISVISTRKGYDVRDFSLLAVGGGGPLCGVSVSNILGMPRCVIPRNAAAFCAKSMFYLDIGRDYVRPYLRNFDQAKPEEIRALVEDMKATAVRDFAYFDVKESDLTFELTADVHYANQYHELELKMRSLDVTQDVLDAMVSGFHKLHKETFTFDLPWVPIQLTNIRMTARMQGSPFKVNRIASGTADASAAVKELRDAYVGGRTVKIPIYDGDKLLAGNTVTGPCVIEQRTATSVIPAGNTVHVDDYGNFIIDWEGGREHE